MLNSVSFILESIKAHYGTNAVHVNAPFMRPRQQGHHASTSRSTINATLIPINVNTTAVTQTIIVALLNP